MKLNFKKISAEQIITNDSKKFVTSDELGLIDSLTNLDNLIQHKIETELNGFQPENLVTSVSDKTGDVQLQLSDIKDVTISVNDINSLSNIDTLRQIIDNSITTSVTSGFLRIDRSFIFLKEPAKTISTVFIQNHGILLQGYSHTKNTNIIELDNSTFDSELAVIIYYI